MITAAAISWSSAHPNPLRGGPTAQSFRGAFAWPSKFKPSNTTGLLPAISWDARGSSPAVSRVRSLATSRKVFVLIDRVLQAPLRGKLHLVIHCARKREKASVASDCGVLSKWLRNA